MRFFFYISFFIFICHVLFSTTEMCGNGAMSPVQNQIYSDNLTNVTLRNSDFISADTILRKIPITFIMATSAEIDLGKLLTDADSAFADMNINFVPHDTLFVDNTMYYHLDTTATGKEEGKAFRKAYNHFNRLNVYIVDTLVGLQGVAPYCGVNDDYYGFSNWVILSNYNGGIDTDKENDNFTFIHELGHHFCLLHTHHGSNDNIDDCIFEGENGEYVNGFECDERGDLLCDTPADPGLNNGTLVKSDCTFAHSNCKKPDCCDIDLCFEVIGDVNGDGIADLNDIPDYPDYNIIEEYCIDDCECLDANGDSYSGLDSNGNYYSPDTKNYMSYTEKICGNHFTIDQTNVITSQYDKNEFNRYLDCYGEFMGHNWFCAGCMEQTACNYNADATIEDFSCEFPIEGYNCESEELFNHSSIKPYNYLLSIYPNPFNPITTISYSISQFMGIIITIYDINGRELETLLNTNLNPGNYSLDWNASNYPSGVYFIRMDCGEFTQIQKVALVK